MKKLAFLVAAASLFAFTPLAASSFDARFGAILASIALVWLGVLLAVSASGAFDSLAIASGALGALGSGVLASVSPTVAGAVLVGAAFAERTTRVRSRTARAVHVLVALVGGGFAGALSNAYLGASLSVFAVAVVVAAVLTALPLLVEADDPVAHALEQAAEGVGEPAKSALVDGAELRRRAAEVPLDRATTARVRSTWRSLLRLAEARIRLQRSRPEALLRLAAGAAPAEAPGAEPESDGPAPDMPVRTNPADAVLEMIDQRIVEHVSVLARAYTAVDAASAARIGLDDSAVKNVESMGDSLEEVSRAIVEVRSEGRAPPA